MKRKVHEIFGRLCSPTLIGVALLVAPTVTFAQEVTHSYPECSKEPTEDEIEAAKGAFQAGNAAFKEANYARAVQYWTDAYDRDCTAQALLLNLARAHELAGEKMQAVIALQTFLEREPQTNEKDQILRRIDVLKAAIEADKKPTVPQGGELNTTPNTVSPPGSGERRAPGKKQITPLIVAGIGGAALVGGSVLFLIGTNKVSEVNRRCYHGDDCGRDPDGDTRSAEESKEITEDGNSGVTLQTAGVCVGGVGAAALIGGITWFALAPRKPETLSATTPHATLTPVFSPSLAGVSLSGRF